MKFLYLLFFMQIVSCTIAPPKIYVATKKTAIEKQLLGDFTSNKNIKLKKYSTFLDSYTIDSSKKSNKIYNSLLFVGYKRSVYIDELNSLLKYGMIGETKNGTVSRTNIKNKSKIKESRVEELIKFENENRKKIFTLSAHLFNTSYAEILSKYNNFIKTNKHNIYIKENNKWIKMD